MTKFCFEIRKRYFEANFTNFWGKKVFPKNPALPCTTSCGFLSPCQNSQKNNDPISTKIDRRKDGRMDTRTERPYFMGPFQLLPGVHQVPLQQTGIQKSNTQSTKHTKKSVQFISSLLRYSRFQSLMNHTHPKITEITFSFPVFVPACKKSVHSICLFLR